MTDTCMKQQWHDRCCCNCVNQRVIFKHPWNNFHGKGKVTEVMGFGCNMEEDVTYDGIPAIIFMDAQHGMCELHNRKDDK